MDLYITIGIVSTEFHASEHQLVIWAAVVFAALALKAILAMREE